ALLEAGADANARQHGGYTALHAAAMHGSGERVELLLAHGADPALPADDGRTAAGFARERGHAAVAARLAPA
ncbi:MAG: ankyrin repeat domain-containing protein, partial [Gemmatimonadetes bacterium]|nr:ankyrin repeat domain-containing protein [Gemmatimonadota bacterium]